MAAVHIEGSMNPPYVYLKHFFRVSVPLTLLGAILYCNYFLSYLKGIVSRDFEVCFVVVIQYILSCYP
jgi:hypothetical protein